MDFLLSAIIGYLIGSFPTAYLILKRKNIDITKAGSGNVGAMNSFEVTNSKTIGIIVLIIDLSKGILSVILVALIYPDNFVFQGMSLIFAVFSHCFNPWINFNGGRGLATTAGGIIVLIYPLLFVWLILWAITYALKKNIHFSNISATILSLVLVFNNSELSVKYCNPTPPNSESVVFIITMGFLIILIKHIEPLKEIIEDLKKKGIKR